MASYTNTTYSNSLYDLNGVYFNSTSQSSSSSAVDLDAFDTRYLIKSSERTISNNLIVSGSVDIQTSLTLPTIGNVEDAIEGKQDTINDGDLTIAKTTGLQTALDNKYDDTGGTINGNVDITGDLVVNDVNVISEIGTKQDTIEDGDLTIAKTSGLQTALDNKYDDTGGTINCNVDITGDLVVNDVNVITEIGTKQDEINNYIDISCKTLTTQGIFVNGTCDIDTTIYFDTIVIRAEDPTLSDSIIELNEIQVWVNNVNIMVQPTTNPVGYFAEWDNKEVPIEANFEDGALRSVDVYMYNNILDDRLSAGGTASAMIIKELPLTSINDIQSIVIYNRGAFREIRALGLVMELYNKENDFDFLTPLASTNMIEVAEKTYRYDFPSIDIYTLGFSTGESTSQIRDSGASDTITEDAIINVVETDINMNGNVETTGTLSVNDVNVITEIGTKQDEITTDTVLSCDSITSKDLIVNNNLNVDDTITYETNQFNTIVIRRFDKTTTLGFNLNELQMWVNDVNILPSNASNLDAYFANWSDKDTEIPASFAEGAVRYLNVYLFNDILEFGVGSAGGGSINAVIIKDIHLTNVNDLQSIVLYHRGGDGNVTQAVGLTIELYNDNI